MYPIKLYKKQFVYASEYKGIINNSVIILRLSFFFSNYLPPENKNKQTKTNRFSFFF